ncbi:MAG: hisS [Candidatus Saccharibacteria bacterium]|nr:hisS [Candidatus Saccharibacteria bacterium]
MNLSTQPYKGARDFYPEDKRIQKYMFDTLRTVAEGYGYQEYDAPIIEPTELYLSKSSDEIVSEQTYSFTDRGDRNVTIRPEMTPTVSRMVAGRRQELAYPLRWYSIPNVWRYERPQAGRLREHWQLNMDLFGVSGIEGDHEMIQIADTIFQAYGADRDMYEIRLNSRQLINEILNDYVGQSADQVLAVIRLIDHKAKMVHEEFMEALEKLIPDGRHHDLDKLLHLKSFEELPDRYVHHPSVKQLIELKELLGENGITNVADDLTLMRGFDYYTDIVFEVFDKHPENNRSLAGGGRYDGLVGLFGVEPVPTVGFAVGDVTLQRFLELHELLPELKPETDVVIILIGDVYKKAQPFIASLRKKGISVAVDPTGRKMDTAIKHAAKSGVRYALFIGEQELGSGQYKLRDLGTGQESDLSQEQVVAALKTE